MTRINGTSSKNGYLFYGDFTEVIPSDYLTTNKTNLEYKIYIQNQGTRFNSNNWTKSTTINDTEVYKQTGQNIASNSVSYNEALCVMSGTITGIEHNADGSKIVDVSAYLSKSTSYSSYDPGYCSLSGQVQLTTIPRTSSVSATSGNIEDSIMININRASDSFTHNLYYSFGSLSNTLIASGVGISYSWQLPADLYSQISNAQYGTGTIICKTYNSSTYIGQSVCSFTAYANESRCRPDISMTVVDTNEKSIALTGSSSKLIKFVSNAKVTLGVSGRNSASIKSSSIYCGNGQTIGGTSTTFNGVDSNYFKGTTIDSRGYSNSTEKTLEMIQYIKLTLNPTVYRLTQTGSEVKAKVTGNYFNGSFGASNNILSLKCRYREEGGEWHEYITLNPTIENNIYTIDISLGTSFDYKKSYEFQFVLADAVSTIFTPKTLTRGIPIHAMFEKFFEYWGIKSFSVSEDGSTLILNGDIQISGSNKFLKNL